MLEKANLDNNEKISFLLLPIYRCVWSYDAFTIIRVTSKNKFGVDITL